MAIFIHRNKGGEPRRVSPMGYKTIEGRVISNLRNAPMSQLRDIDVFMLNEVTEVQKSSFQTLVLEGYEWDVATMIVTATYKVEWRELEATRAEAQAQVEQMTHNAVADGYTWNGDIYDGRDVLVPGAKGQVLIRSIDKTNIMHIQQQMQAGIISEMDWKVGENRYIRITGMDVIAQISGGGLIYESKVLGLRKRFAADICECESTEDLYELMDGIIAAYDEIPGRWKGEE